MLRLWTIVPTLCAFVALILSLLCVFAGSKPGMLENYDILTLNTSHIALDIFNTSSSGSSGTSTGSDSFFGQLIHNYTNDVQDGLDSLESKINKELSEGLQSIAQTIGLHDFYSIHVLDFCEGFYTPANGSKKNVTHCSNSTSLFSWDPNGTLQRELNASGLGFTLKDLHFPSAIDSSLHDLRMAFRVMFVLYCIGIIATGISMLASTIGFFVPMRVVCIVNVALASFAWFVLLITSAIVTGAANHATNAINKYGEDIGVNATKGSNLIAMTWAATILMIVASLVWVVDFFIFKKLASMTPEKFQTKF